jgi:hypothetical protein
MTPGDGSRWAERLRAGLAMGGNKGKRSRLSEEFWAENKMGCRNCFRILIQGFGFKFQRFKYFKPNLNYNQTRINLNKLFDGFSNLELFKISLSIQIQTKALNRGLWK